MMISMTKAKRKKSNRIVQSKTDKIVDIFVHILTLSFTFLVIFPFWTVLMDSFSKTDIHLSLRLLPDGFSLEAYAAVLSQNTLLTAYANTLFRTLAGSLLTVVVTFMAAYPLSKREMPFNRILTYAMLLTMYFSGGLVPVYLVVQKLNLIDNRWVLIVPGVFSAYYIIVMRNFVYAIPRELEESAFLDGANDIVIAFKIYLPLMKPIIATICLWSVVALWNEWFYAMIYIIDPRKQVVQVFLRRLIMQAQVNAMFDNTYVVMQQSEEAIKAATMFVTILPILVSYPFAQKYFIKDLAVGAVKG